jgi:S-adenosylmethionine/arginine decarboxylase-like enzyme
VGIELSGISAEVLEGGDIVVAKIWNLLNSCGYRILDFLQHHSGTSTGGVSTGLVVLVRAYIAIYADPSRSYLAIDVFSLDGRVPFGDWLERIIKEFPAHEVRRHDGVRGGFGWPLM